MTEHKAEQASRIEYGVLLPGASAPVVYADGDLARRVAEAAHGTVQWRSVVYYAPEISEWREGAPA